MKATRVRAKRFERPVIIRTGGSDRTIFDVNAAAEILLKAFPKRPHDARPPWPPVCA
jgi:hypothetical protein